MKPRISSLVLLRRRNGWAVETTSARETPVSRGERELAGTGHPTQWSRTSPPHSRHAGLTPGARVGVVNATLDMSQANFAHPPVDLGSTSDGPRRCPLTFSCREKLANRLWRYTRGRIFSASSSGRSIMIISPASSHRMICHVSRNNLASDSHDGTLLGPLISVSNLRCSFAPFEHEMAYNRLQ